MLDFQSAKLKFVKLLSKPGPSEIILELNLDEMIKPISVISNPEQN